MSRITKILTAGLFFAAIPLTSAQESVVKVEVIGAVAQTQKSPDFEVGSGIKDVRDNRKDWAQFTTEFMVTGGDRRSDFVSDIEFRYFVLPASAPKETKKLYATTINHVDVPKGEKLYSAVYLSPNAIQKIYGKGRSVNPRDFWVAVEIYVAGKLVGYKISDKQDLRWWRREDVEKDSATLRPKHKTPFRDLWYDVFAEVRD